MKAGDKIYIKINLDENIKHIGEYEIEKVIIRTRSNFSKGYWADNYTFKKSLIDGEDDAGRAVKIVSHSEFAEATENLYQKKISSYKNSINRLQKILNKFRLANEVKDND